MRGLPPACNLEQGEVRAEFRATNGKPEHGDRLLPSAHDEN
jgi:hypothetical protein